MAFTVIPNSDIDPGSPASTDLFTKLRDNDDFLFAQRAGLVLVEKKLVTADVTDVDFAGLDGDTDEVYKIIGRIVTTSANTIELQPNTLSTNLASRLTENGATSVATTTLLLTRGVSGATRLLLFEATFWAKKNPNAVAVDRGLLSLFASSAIVIGSTVGKWSETTINVTSLRIHGTVASGIRNGSTIELYKLRQS